MLHASALSQRQGFLARARRAGSTVVDFAVVAPVLFLVVLGMVEVGRAFMVNHVLTNAARVGSRKGMIQGATTSTITSAVNSYLSSNKISGATVTVTVNGTTSDASSAAEEDEIKVVVAVPVANVTWIPGTNFISGNLSGQYALRRD